jgi:hypothetical protein
MKGSLSGLPLLMRKSKSTGGTGCGKKALFCHSERSEESLFDLSVRKETGRDSSLRSE